MDQPLLVDLFCGVGAASVGYRRAGFRIVGVDIDPQPDYPFDFIQADAIEFLHRMIAGDAGLTNMEACHASPPCQASCALTKGTNQGREYPQLIPQTRQLLDALGLPYVIENVQGSELRRDLTLCGEMFGLDVIRHRYFELGYWAMIPPIHRPHRGRVRGWRHGVYHDGPYVAVYGEGGGKGSVAEWQRAMRIHWTENRKSIAEAIPPAYTEHIGRYLRTRVEAGRVTAPSPTRFGEGAV